MVFCGILGESVRVSKTAGPFEGSICGSLALGQRPPTKSNLGWQRPLHGVGEDKLASLPLQTRALREERPDRPPPAGMCKGVKTKPPTLKQK